MEINRYFKFHLFGFLADEINFAPNHVYFHKMMIIDDLIQEAKTKFNISTSCPFLLYFLNDSGYLILIKNKIQILELLAPTTTNSGIEKQMISFVLKPEIGVFVYLVLDNRDSLVIDYQNKKFNERLVVLDTELSWTNLLQTLAEIIGISHNSELQIAAVTDITRTIRYTTSQSIRSGDTLVLHILKKESNIPPGTIPVDNNSHREYSDSKKSFSPLPVTPPSSIGNSYVENHQGHQQPPSNRFNAQAPEHDLNPIPKPPHQISPVNNLKGHPNSHCPPTSPPNHPTIKQSPPTSPTYAYTSQLHQAIYRAFLQLDLTVTKEGLDFLIEMSTSADDAVDFYYERGQEFFLRKNYIIIVGISTDPPIDQTIRSNANNVHESGNNRIEGSKAPLQDWQEVNYHKSQSKSKGGVTESSATIPIPSSLTSLGSPLLSDGHSDLRGASSPTTLSRSKSTTYGAVEARADLSESRAAGHKKPELVRRSVSVSSVTADHQDKLLGMGYSQSRIHEAFLRCSSLESAIDYLGAQDDAAAGGEGGREGVESMARKGQQDVGGEGEAGNSMESLERSGPSVEERTALVCLICSSGHRINPPTQCILSGCLLNHSYCCFHYLTYFNQRYLKRSSRLLPCCMYAGSEAETDDGECGHTMTDKNVQDILKTMQLYCDVETVLRLKSVFSLLYRIESHRQRAEFWCTRCAQGEEEPLNWYRSQPELKSYSDEQCWFSVSADANRQCPRCPRCLLDFCALCGISPFHHGSKCETLLPLTLFWREWLAKQKALGSMSEKRFNALLSGATSRINAMEDVHIRRCQPEVYRKCPTCQRVRKKTTQSDVTICGITVEVHGHAKVLDGCGATYDWLSGHPVTAKRPTTVTLPGYDSKLTPTQLNRVNHKIMCTICKKKIVGNRLDCVFCLNVTLCSVCCLDLGRKICPDNHIFKVTNKTSDEHSSIHKTNE